MRCAIIADIHANLEAFTAVLGEIEHQGGVDEVWSLGDIVGYGPDPVPCIELLRRYNHVSVAGNHDRAAIGKLELSFFNPLAAEACRWTAARLGKEHVRYLENLPLTADRGDFLLVHGSPTDPVLEYVMSTGIAARNFAFFGSAYCLVGHTHVPAAFKEEDGSCRTVPMTPGIGMMLGADRLIINPGGVGQPRDGDPSASYAIYDSRSRIFRLFRIPYDIEATQQKMLRAGLPVQLATRLAAGR
ncbi:MAG TPA: metallophosphoesterase family protein [Dehalococcoidales bacterium]|nr:metallophosphoesterase family protein [Dehalococcoidales bacterium]